MKTRPKQNFGPIPENPYDVTQWTYEQIRAAGAWSRHEIEAKHDPLTAAYEWEPDWIGDMTPEEVNLVVMQWFRTGGAK